MKTEIQHHFQEIRQIIRQGQSAALQAVNTYLLFVNWQIGAYLSQSLPASTYGDKVVDHLAQWLQEQEPGIKGYDRRSLYRMKLFFETWMAVDWSLISGYTIQNAQVNLHNVNNEIVGSLTPQSPPKFVDKNLLRRMLHQWTEDWRQARIITDIDSPENADS